MYTCSSIGRLFGRAESVCGWFEDGGHELFIFCLRSTDNANVGVTPSQSVLFVFRGSDHLYLRLGDYKGLFRSPWVSFDFFQHLKGMLFLK